MSSAGNTMYDTATGAKPTKENKYQNTIMLSALVSLHTFNTEQIKFGVAFTKRFWPRGLWKRHKLESSRLNPALNIGAISPVTENIPDCSNIQHTHTYRPVFGLLLLLILLFSTKCHL